MQASDDGTPESSEVEFFGVKLKVRSAQLAALLNSSVHDDVQVIGRRALDAFGQADDGREGTDDGCGGSGRPGCGRDTEEPCGAGEDVEA